MHEWQSQSHVKWECKYHVVIVPKYRKKLLYGKLRDQVGPILKELCRQKGVEVVEGHVMPDHVHLLLTPLRDVAILGIAIAALAAVEVTRAPRRALVLAAAAAARDGAGGRYAARAQGDIDAVRVAAAAALGAGQAAAAWTEGSRLLFTEAAALALGRSPGRNTAAPGGLTRRELQIASLVGAGLTDAQVAHQLHLSHRTVENHVAHALAKLGARNRTELAARLAGHTSAE